MEMMNLEYTPYLLPSALGAALSLSVAWLAWRRRPARSAGALALMCLASGIWGVGNVLELSGTDIATKHAGLLLQYPGILAAAPSLLIFSLHYTERATWLTRRHLLAYALLPVLSYAIILTNPLHQLMWINLRLTRGPFLMLTYESGIWWWMTVIYSYLMLMVATFLLIKRMMRSLRLYRMQLALTLLGVLAPWISNLIFIMRINPIPNWDMTPLAFSITGLALGWGLLRLGMLDIAPIARELLIERMSDGMLVLDQHNRLVDFNQAMETILGRNLARAIGQPVEQVLAPWTDLMTQYQNQHNAQAEIAIVGHTQTYYYDLRISALSDRRGEYSGRLVVLRDITERKLAEQALRQHAAELEASNAELDAFAHTVAHDLKTPLTALLGFAMLLNQRAARWPIERIQTNSEYIVLTGKKMDTIINELLLLADVRRSATVACVSLDMGSIVTEAQRRLSTMLEEYNAAIILPESWPLAYGHAPWVEEVWVNYITNALKYGGSPPQVELGYTLLEEASTATPLAQVLRSKIQNPQSRIAFWVRDNGAGLTAEQQQRLFTQFTRLHKNHAQGHGLGLSIVQRIVTRLRGEVGVESTPSEGCTFWFTLPDREC